VGEKYDAIIIGANIIEACIAFERAKKSWQTLNVDKLPAARCGPTGSSCGIIRLHYRQTDRELAPDHHRRD
jgi:sarcosine oxidase subunit beta